MTGTGHHVAAVGAALPCFFFCPVVVTDWPGSSSILSLLGALGCVTGGKAPDWLEFPIFGHRLIPHRTLTHWIPLWLITFLALLIVPLDPPIQVFLLGFVVGNLVHISGDALTPMGIPVWSPMRRKTLARWRSGGFQEATWVLGVWAVSMCTAWVPMQRFL